MRPASTAVSSTVPAHARERGERPCVLPGNRWPCVDHEGLRDPVGLWLAGGGRYHRIHRRRISSPNEVLPRWRAGRGLVDANLGGGVIKQHVARKGVGRAGGFRTIILFRRHELAFFVYGFSKNSRENLRRDELGTYRLLAGEYLALDRTGVAAAQAAGSIIEVTCDDQAIQE